MKCSNYIGHTLDFVSAYGFENMLLIGNIGKLVKTAAGIMNTHSKVADGRAEIMAIHAVLNGGDRTAAEKIMDCINTDEMIEVLKKYKIFEKTMDSIAKAAYKHISSRAGKNVNCGIVMFSEKYGKLCSCGNIERIIGKIKEEKR